MPSTIRIPQPPGLFGKDLLRRGIQYLDAFRHLTQDGTTPWPHASFFLLCHSLELFLKAKLSSAGVEKRAVIDMGHKLNQLFVACQSAGLPPVENLDNLVAHAALMNSDHDFRYPTPYRLKMPSPSECLVVMDDFELAIEPAVRSAALKAKLHLLAEIGPLRGRIIVWSD